MNARFAISVPIGAWHPLLGDCLASLAAQNDLVEFAALDASGDPRVAELLDGYSDRIAYRRTGPDKGQSAAIIEGWKNTKAPMLGWLNADDALYLGALDAVARKFDADPALDLAYGDSTIIDDDGAYRGYHWAVRPPGEDILTGCTISQPSCFFKRDAVTQIGGLNADLHYTMDWDLWVRLWRAGAKFGFVDEVLSRVLWSDDAKTGGFNAQRRSELERIIGANDGALAKMKSRIGFALHHVLEYRAPAPVARVVRRRKARQGRIIHGLNRAGGVGEIARLPLVCWGDGRLDAVALEFSSESAGEVMVQGRQADYAGGTCRIDLETPPATGDTLEIVIKPSRPTNFLAARWA